MPAYRPGQGLSEQAVDRLKARTQAQSGAFALPAQDNSKQWDHLLGGGAKKKTRCSLCTRPLGDNMEALGEKVCALCVTAPPQEQRPRPKNHSTAHEHAAPESRRASIRNAEVVPKVSEVTKLDRSAVLTCLHEWHLTRKVKDSMDGGICHTAESTGGSTVDPEEAEDEDWVSWLNSAFATPEMHPAKSGHLKDCYLPTEVKSGVDMEQCCSVGSTADPDELEDESWDTWLDSA